MTEAVDEDAHQSIKSEDNVIYKNKGKTQKTFSYLQWLMWLIYDNDFMDRLFPEIKQ